MPVVRHGEPLNVLVVAKGHPVSRATRSWRCSITLPGIACSLVEQPAARKAHDARRHDRTTTPWCCTTCQGWTSRSSGEAWLHPPPSEVFRAGFLAMLDAGKGIVALHHALAGWPAWPEYADLLGGRFLYRPGELRGSHRPDSGYRHDVEHTVTIADPGHPVAEGVPAGFTLTDELYLCEVFEADVQPLLRSDASFTRDRFYSAKQAVNGRMFSNEGWAHDDGSNLVGWTKRARNSPLVYLQPGDGPSTYADPTYRRLIENAIRWVASSSALRWGRGEAADEDGVQD